MNAVPSCAAAAPSMSDAAIPAPSIIPPDAITGMSSSFTRSRVKGIVPSRSSGPSGSNIPRCPPASYPCATTASMPAAAMALPSSRLVAVAMSTIPAECKASIRCRSGRPKWKLTTAGRSVSKTESFALSVRND